MANFVGDLLRGEQEQQGQDQCFHTREQMHSMSQLEIDILESRLQQKGIKNRASKYHTFQVQSFARFQNAFAQNDHIM